MNMIMGYQLYFHLGQIIIILGKNLKKITRELDIVENVNFLGDINENQKKYLFKNTDLMVMPTLDESKKNSIEGFGIAYLEAAFFGIPSIASNLALSLTIPKNFAK